MKLLVDACISPLIVASLRADGHDVIHVADWGPGGEDRAILARAFSERRTVVTLDKDFGELVVREAAQNFGVVRLVDLALDDQAWLCPKVLVEHEANLVAGAIVTVTLDRIRVRLPKRSLS